MIDARWLILIVPVSMAIGALALICVACIIAGEQADEEINKACGMEVT